MSLTDELERLAQRAPVAHVPADTWARARRARRRNRVLALSVTAVVLLAVGAVAWPPDRSALPVAVGSGAAVPDRLYAVPDGLAADDDPAGVGVGAAAWVTADGVPVVVDATEGGYHLLDLPSGAAVVALAPDGTRLAYAPEAGGLRVVDLASGEEHEVAWPDAGVVDRVRWSPGSTWLSFAGASVLGRVPPGSAVAEVRTAPAGLAAIEVGDDGQTVLDLDGDVGFWRGDRILRPHALADPAMALRLGTSADGTAVRLDELDDGSTTSVMFGSIDATPRPIIELPVEIAPSLSVATGLISLGRLPVTRPEPSWPWSTETKLLVYGGSALALIALVTLSSLALTRRRRVES